MRQYEIMFILAPDADDGVIERATQRIGQILAERGGELGAVDRWGKRRLAFELAKQTEGFYVVARFVAEPATIKEIDRVLSLADEVIRFKIVVRGEAVGTEVKDEASVA